MVNNVWCMLRMCGERHASLSLERGAEWVRGVAFGVQAQELGSYREGIYTPARHSYSVM